MNPNHPEAIAAQQRAKQREMERAAERATINEAQKEGINFVEVTPASYDFTDKPVTAGRMTVAYRLHGRNIVEVSTAICHRQDDFNKQTGRALAALAMMNGQSILLRKPTLRRPYSAKQFVVHTFTVQADD